jgi:hypothetical protein
MKQMPQGLLHHAGFDANGATPGKSLLEIIDTAHFREGGKPWRRVSEYRADLAALARWVAAFAGMSGRDQPAWA